MTTPTTPEQLLALNVSELAASGNNPINSSTLNHPAPNVTLRTAVGTIFWKAAALLGLQDRPRKPTLWDDQYGHVLNARAEGLQNQALLAALCEAAKIDAATVIADATASFNVPEATS